LKISKFSFFVLKNWKFKFFKGQSFFFFENLKKFDLFSSKSQKKSYDSQNRKIETYNFDNFLGITKNEIMRIQNVNITLIISWTSLNFDYFIENLNFFNNFLTIAIFDVIRYFYNSLSSVLILDPNPARLIFIWRQLQFLTSVGIPARPENVKTVIHVQLELSKIFV